MDIKSQREAIGKTVQTCGADDLMVEGALLTNWVLIAEFITPDGERRLTRFDSEDMTTWMRRGMLDDALYGADWEPADGER